MMNLCMILRPVPVRLYQNGNDSWTNSDIEIKSLENSLSHYGWWVLCWILECVIINISSWFIFNFSLKQIVTHAVPYFLNWPHDFALVYKSEHFPTFMFALSALNSSDV